MAASSLPPNAKTQLANTPKWDRKRACAMVVVVHYVPCQRSMADILQDVKHTGLEGNTLARAPGGKARKMALNGTYDFNSERW